MYIKCDRIICENGSLDGYLVIENGKIIDFYSRDAVVDAFIDYSGYRIIPGIIDTHIHGINGFGLFGGDCSDPECEVKGFLKGCAANGITGVFPTTSPDMCKVVAKVAKEQPDGARILGIHSEGPYLNRTGEKGIEAETPTVDMDLVKKIYEDCDGLLKLMAIAPEIKDSQKVIDYLREKNVVLSFAHSNCNYEEAMHAFQHGLSVSTHTANVMSGIHHRDMGGLGACLLNENVYCEVICDGMHVNPIMLEIMFRLKDFDHWFMVSDASQACGAPVGTYKFFGDTKVTIDESGFSKTDTGRLMGSTKTVLYGISVLANQLNIPLKQILRMSSLNAAQFYGLGEQKGSIAVGKDADLVVINDDYEAIATYVEGRLVYDSRIDKELFNEKYLTRFKIEEGV
ncbi:MAG TPA: N-acetylglucosamine-6-phosphate deacetylase [Clostridiales bacterium]|nr:N-acetylglucosamine-6-phosphate deacetylase [Clostridiales bacterium]